LNGQQENKKIGYDISYDLHFMFHGLLKDNLVHTPVVLSQL